MTAADMIAALAGDDPKQRLLLEALVQIACNERDAERKRAHAEAQARHKARSLNQPESVSISSDQRVSAPPSPPCSPPPPSLALSPSTPPISPPSPGSGEPVFTLSAPEKPAVRRRKSANRHRPQAEGPSNSGLESFPKATCDAGFDKWVTGLGAVDYGRFRKALLPVFQAKPDCYTGKELADAVEAFGIARDYDDAKWWGKWTTEKFAAELHEWVRLGRMEVMDEWGAPTERTRMLGFLQ